MMINAVTPRIIPKTLQTVNFSLKHMAATMAPIMVLPPFIKVKSITGGTVDEARVASWLIMNTATERAAPKVKSSIGSRKFLSEGAFFVVTGNARREIKPRVPKEIKENTETSPSGTQRAKICCENIVKPSESVIPRRSKMFLKEKVA